MEKILGRRKSHRRRKRPKRNKCRSGWLSSVKESVGLWRWASRKAEGWHFSTLSKGLGDSGLYRLDRKRLQDVRNAHGLVRCMGWRSNTNYDYVYHSIQVV
jgi:hypothetical protein